MLQCSGPLCGWEVTGSKRLGFVLCGHVAGRPSQMSPMIYSYRDKQEDVFKGQDPTVSLENGVAILINI